MNLSTNAKVAIARNVAAGFRVGRKVFGRGDQVQTKRSGVNWALDLGEGIDFAIYLLSGFEVATSRRYKQLVQPGDVVLDIGANVGAHTLPLERTSNLHDDHSGKLKGTDGAVVTSLQKNSPACCATSSRLILCPINFGNLKYGDMTYFLNCISYCRLFERPLSGTL